MIVDDNSERIKDFREYMSQKLIEVDTLSSNESLLFKKILYVSFLDSISACVFPNTGNKVRFIGLIERFSHWEDRNRVCIVHLSKFCTINSDPELEKIRDFVLSELKSWQENIDGTSIVRATNNPKYEEVRNLWEKSSKESSIRYQLSDFKMVNLLYQLRNSLVHQFQIQGKEFGPLLPEEPFYQLFKSFDGDENLVPAYFELVYPVKFLSSLCNSVLENTVHYFERGNLNPFFTFYAGDFWLSELNK